MATLRPAKTEKAERRIKEVINVAHQTFRHFKADTQESPTWVADVEATVQRAFPLPLSPALTSQSPELDQAGVALWNASTSLLRRSEDPRKRTHDEQQTPLIHQAALLRTFGCLLLDAACACSSHLTKDLQQRIRTFKIALRAVRFCLDNNEIALTQKPLERCAEYAIAVEEAAPVIRMIEESEAAEHETALNQLTQEYYLLRVMHSWKTDRLDLAEHFYNKASPSIAEDMAERAADLFHAIGANVAKKQNLPAAKNWLARAAKTVDACDIEQLKTDISELRLTIAASQVRAFLLSKDLEDLRSAEAVINELETTHGLGNRVAVSLMRFDVATASQPVDVVKMRSTLLRMLRLGVMTEQIFRIFMKTIHKARDADAACACDALAELITARLLPIWQPLEAGQGEQSIQEWLEKATVTYVLFVTKFSDPQKIVRMEELFDTIKRTVNSGISAKATHAAQTLLWKNAGASPSEHADAWSAVLQHPLFDNAGLLNKTRIARKAILTAMAKNDLDSARRGYFAMPPAAQAENLSKYIAFKLALKSNDYDLAAESLESITKQAGKDSSYLYACALEATHSGMRHMAVAALQAIAQILPPGPHTPSLLRCTARLLISEISQLDRALDETLPPVIDLCESAMQETKNLRKDSEAQWRSEIQWWSKNTYNLALRVCGAAQPAHLVELLDICINFLECWPKDGKAMLQKDIEHRRLLCHFLCASACVVIGRSSQQENATVLVSYTRARRQIKAFNTLHQQKQTRDLEMQDRAFLMLKYDLESILKLQQWEDLDATLAQCLDFSSLDHWDTLADIVIIIHEQTKSAGINNAASARVPELLQNIINTTWKKDKDIVKVARWVRLTFTMYLDDEGESVSLKLLRQAANMAGKGSEGRGERYPGDELGWLATTAFNKAVDFLAAQQNDSAVEWVEGALELARYADDDGELHSILTHHKEMAETRVREGVV
ncbi:hypothetical protein MBLNU230_g8402t1 [Neophaeotheca triangularis]